MGTSRLEQRVKEGFPHQRMVVLPRPVVERAIQGQLPLAMVPSDVGYFPDAKSHHVDRPQGSLQCIMILCVRGHGWIHIGQARQEVRPGNLVVILPGQAHSYGCDADRPWSIYWCHAAGTATRYFTDTLAQHDVLPLSHIAGYLQLITLFEQIIDELTMGYSLKHLTVAAMTLAHLLALIAARGQSVAAAETSHARIQQAIDYMKECRQNTISVPDIARASNLSTSHFSALFKQSTGYSPLDYFLRLKMQRAAEMLDTTTRPLKEISADLGFSDPLYFSRAFHRIYSVPPSAYRRTTKG
ncbi:MAG: helix-turn-helix domain-containing protein [Phycisphaerae bacterium]